MGSCDFEAVSALVDGELSETECDAVIEHLNECRDCCRLFERFHTTRTLVRGESEIVVPEGFCERVAAAIAHEEPLPPAREEPLPPGSSGRDPGLPDPSRGAFRPQGGWLAMAAGVAGVAVAGALLWTQTSVAPISEPGSSASPSLAQSSESTPNPKPSATTRDSSPSPILKTSTGDQSGVATIRRYLPEHSSLVPSGPKAEFHRTRLEVGKR
ncbi:MAG TPA: sigma-E factor negative regulatory protein [Gammaproteobacteria bacterium]|nr:sigma-E factor negative regulatory protein [Gammaproteobacteria bacterium]